MLKTHGSMSTIADIADAADGGVGFDVDIAHIGAQCGFLGQREIGTGMQCETPGIVEVERCAGPSQVFSSKK